MKSEFVRRLEKLLLEFVDFMQQERELSRYSRLAYLNDLRQLVRFIDCGGWNRNWERTLIRFESFQKKQQFSERTVERRIYVARRFAMFCTDKQLNVRDWDFVRSDAICRRTEWPVCEKELKTSARVQVAVEVFLSEVERLRARNTAKAYRNDLGGFGRFFEERRVGAITKPLIEEYVDSLSGKSSTVRRTAAAIQAFCRWAVVQGLLNEDPSVGLGSKSKFPETAPNLETLPSIDQVQGKTVSTAFSERDDVIMDFVCTYALRPHEIVELDSDDVDVLNGILKVGSRVIGIKDYTIRLMQRYLGARSLIAEDDAFILNKRGTRLTTRSLGRIVKDYSVKLGLSSVTHPMSLRRSGIAKAASSGVEMEVTMRRVGSFSREILDLYPEG